MKELRKKYKVSCTNKEEKNFNAFDECVRYIKNKVWIGYTKLDSF